MSDSEQPSAQMSAQEAKAEAKAAKARAKALRPWFKKKRFIVPIALVIIGGFSSLAGGGEDSPSTNADSSSSSGSESSSSSSDGDATTEEEAAPAMVGIGQVAQEGNFAFVVNAVECGIASVGSDLLGEEAQGQFCKIEISVENTGDEAEYFSADSQLVYDDQGREFEADTSAMLYLDEGDGVWIGDDINPGNSIDASLLFDLPEGVEPVQIRLVEGFFGVGVDVALN